MVTGIRISAASPRRLGRSNLTRSTSVSHTQPQKRRAKRSYSPSGFQQTLPNLWSGELVAGIFPAGFFHPVGMSQAYSRPSTRHAKITSSSPTTTTTLFDGANGDD